MCGLGIGAIFTLAIAIMVVILVVILVVLALLRATFGVKVASITAMPYWKLIPIVIGGVVAIVLLLIINCGN
jgi:hypothetical protein